MKRIPIHSMCLLSLAVAIILIVRCEQSGYVDDLQPDEYYWDQYPNLISRYTLSRADLPGCNEGVFDSTNLLTTSGYGNLELTDSSYEIDLFLYKEFLEKNVVRYFHDSFHDQGTYFASIQTDSFIYRRPVKFSDKPNVGYKINGMLTFQSAKGDTNWSAEIDYSTQMGMDLFMEYPCRINYDVKSLEGLVTGCIYQELIHPVKDTIELQWRKEWPVK